MNTQVNTKINIDFEKLSEYKINDTRFTKVKIWLMHLNENYNGSIFTEEATTNAIPSLANTPILGYIQENSDNEDDFSDHRMELERNNSEIKVKYKGSAYGVIPETNYAKFENKICKDGKERTFLTCQGLLWNKFDDGINIFNRDIIKDESMELAENYTGSFNQDGYFVFDKFLFDGACALGCGVQPAMEGACIEINFALNEIKAKLEQYQNYINNQSSFEVDIENYNQRKEDEILTENIEETVVETTKEFTDVVEPIVETVNEEVIETPNTEEVIEETEIKPIVDVVEDVVDEVVVEMVEKSEFEKLQLEFEEYKANYSTPNSEVERLQKFEKDTIDTKYETDVIEVFTRFEKQLNGVAEFETLKEKYNGMEVNTIEEKCFAMLGKKNANFSVKQKDTMVKLPINHKDEEIEDPYGGLLAKKYK